MFFGCVSYRSEIHGQYSGTAPGNPKSTQTQVSVFFHFSHLEQAKGYDAVPKIISPDYSFRDIFSEAMKEITNIKSFATFTDYVEDINDVHRRKTRDSLKLANDFTIHISIKKENAFGKHFLADLFSYSSGTIIPVGYTWDYIITADVLNSESRLLKSYTRNASLSTWTNIVLVFVYPFYASHGVTEEIYFESLRDILSQINDEGILNK